MQVTGFMELKQAVECGEKDIRLANSISMPETLHLRRGQKLSAAEDAEVFLSFINTDGVGLSGDNEITGIAIQTNPSKRAIYIDSTEEDLGTITLKDLTVTGVVQLLTRSGNKRLHIAADTLDIVQADARGFSERPMKYGVIVYQGAFTVYNFNPDPNSLVTVRAEHITLGRKAAPVIGSGVFISGFNDETGFVKVEKLTTGEIHSNGMIPTGQPNLITAGIFIVYGAQADAIESYGPVSTYGTNDMVLDVWGKVKNWVAKEKVTSYGPSGIGFVNFGEVEHFRAEAPIRTFGLGARGFNQYDGTIGEAYFQEIRTVNDGSIGMQFSKPVGKITVADGITTEGSTGQTLVKGVIKELSADGISVVEGGEIEELIVTGDIRVKGDEVTAYHVDKGHVRKFRLEGEIIAESDKSKDVVIENGGTNDGF